RMQMPAQREAILVREQHVEYDEVDIVGLEYAAHLFAVGSDADLEKLFAKVARGELSDLPIIVDDQDMVRGFHSPAQREKAGGASAQCHPWSCRRSFSWFGRTPSARERRAACSADRRRWSSR